MWLGEIENDVLERLNYDYTQSDSAPRLRIRRSLNKWQRRILTTPGLEQLREDITSFASIANQARYALPQHVSRINRIYEPNTNRIRLVERSLDWYRNLPTTISGVPECYIPLSRTTTQLMVGGNVSAGFLSFGPTASGLWVVSDSTSDTTQAFFMESTRTGGYLQRDKTALNGTTRVQVNTNTDFVEVNKAFLDLPAVGNVSLYDAATGGNQLLQIAPNKLTASYLIVVLWPAPSGVWTFYVDYTREIQDMQQPSDEPVLPMDFQDLLGMGARYDEYEYKKDTASATLLRTEITIRANALFNWVTNNPDNLIVPGQQPRGTRFSNLGSWFPSGTW